MLSQAKAYETVYVELFTEMFDQGKLLFDCIVWYLLDRPLNLNLNTYNGESLVTRSGQPLSSWASHFERGHKMSSEENETETTSVAVFYVDFNPF